MTCCWRASTEQHIHFVAREDADMTGLHAANVLQTSDVVRAAQAGLVIGGAVGARGRRAGRRCSSRSSATRRNGASVAVLAMLGGAFGAWASSMIGISTPSNRLKRFEPAIEQGQILLMVDVPRSRVEEIEDAPASPASRSPPRGRGAEHPGVSLIRAARRRQRHLLAGGGHGTSTAPAPLGAPRARLGRRGGRGLCRRRGADGARAGVGGAVERRRPVAHLAAGRRAGARARARCRRRRSSFDIRRRRASRWPSTTCWASCSAWCSAFIIAGFHCETSLGVDAADRRGVRRAALPVQFLRPDARRSRGSPRCAAGRPCIAHLVVRRQRRRCCTGGWRGAARRGAAQLRLTRPPATRSRHHHGDRHRAAA